MANDELATAVQYGVGVIVLVINNNMYGTIRIHQENRFGGRATGTSLVNPDFVAYARAFGAHAEAVSKTAEFEGAFERALASRGPALIELRIDPDAIHTRYSLSSLKEGARKRAAMAGAQPGPGH
jgi:acetolactate synthase-1/2/3 large subunit